MGIHPRSRARRHHIGAQPRRGVTTSGAAYVEASVRRTRHEPRRRYFGRVRPGASVAGETGYPEPTPRERDSLRDRSVSLTGGLSPSAIRPLPVFVVPVNVLEPSCRSLAACDASFTLTITEPRLAKLFCSLAIPTARRRRRPRRRSRLCAPRRDRRVRRGTLLDPVSQRWQSPVHRARHWRPTWQSAPLGVLGRDVGDTGLVKGEDLPA